MDKRLIIAIDGPAGSGKSTVSRLIAKRLGLLYIDTGAMYRALTLKAMNNNVDLSDEEALVKLAKGADIRLTEKDDSLFVYLDGSDVTTEIRSPQVTGNVKYIARVPGVRAEMVRMQRKTAGLAKGAVLEGRDIGTVVFPDAERKFYLDASAKERAKRRFKELVAQGQKVALEQIERDVVARDESDKNRKAGPLKKADDAICVDTTSLSIDDVVNKILNIIK